MKRLSPSIRHIEHSKIEYSMSVPARRKALLRRGGFTLIELLVVIAIAAILSALLLGGFFNLSASNKRLSCQTNLQSIYGALRMYAADNDGGYPYYNAASTNGGTVTTPTNATPEDTRFGLWALYTNDRIRNSNPLPLDFPSNRVPDATPGDLTDNPLRPIGIYLRSSESLHCPADRDNAELYSDATRTAFNPNYLSYQTLDNGVATYQSQRDVNAVVSGVPNPLWKRQLMFFNGAQRVFDQRAASNTVITWCKWHRTGLGASNLDPILFADGSVRAKPFSSVTPGWQRTND